MVASLSPAQRSTIHQAFQVGVVLKGLNGLLELTGGILLLWFPPGAIQGLVVRLTQMELSEDPRDFIATHLRAAAAALSADAARFAALYLLSHGLIKIGLVYALLRGKQWAYPWAIAIFAAFAIYQIYRYFITYSGWLIALTVLDGIVIVLTTVEWRQVREKQTQVA